MSESPKTNPEISKTPEPSRGLARDPDFTSGSKTPEQFRQEALNSLGFDFNVSWDAFTQKADFSGLRSKLLNKDKTFKQEAFFEAINKLNPEYLKHIQRLFKEEMTAELNKKEDKYKTKTENEEEKQEILANLAKPFINRVEFFSRLKPPETLIIGGKTRDQLITEMEQNNIQISDYARQMMQNEAFTTTKKPEKVDFTRLTVTDLFDDSKKHTTDEIYAKAEKQFGLALCESQDGPNYRLHYTNQPQGEYFRMGMKPISDPDGYPRVFDLGHGEDGVWLHDYWPFPAYHWLPGLEFVFRLSSPKSERDQSK